jgi:hypothetical protein
MTDEQSAALLPLIHAIAHDMSSLTNGLDEPDAAGVFSCIVASVLLNGTKTSEDTHLMSVRVLKALSGDRCFRD